MKERTDTIKQIFFEHLISVLRIRGPVVSEVITRYTFENRSEALLLLIKCTEITDLKGPYFLETAKQKA